MKRSNSLVLDHLIENKLIEPDINDEILFIFPPSVASSMAVSAVSSFNFDGTIDGINSKFKIDWIIQLVSYCCSLPILYYESIISSLKIFRHWILSNDIFENNIQKNIYSRKILVYCSSVFDYRKDQVHPIDRFIVIHYFLDNIEEYISKCSFFEDETWELLLIVLIGSADFFSSENSIINLPDLSRKKILKKIYDKIFSIFNINSIENEKIWNIFLKFTSKWSKSLIYLNSWSDSIIYQYKTILNCFFNNSKLENQKILGYLKNSIDFNIISNDFDLFQELGNCLEKIYKISNNFINNSEELFRKKFSINFFLSLFGNWIFDPFLNGKTNLFKIISKILLKILGKWFISKDSNWYTLILSVLSLSMEQNSSSLLINYLTYGYNLLPNYSSNLLFEQFLNIFEKFSIQDINLNNFWKNSSILLLNISNFIEIPENILIKYLSIQKDLKSLSTIFLITCRNSINLFYLKSLEIFQFTINNKQTFFINLSMNLNLILASNIPFIKFNNPFDFLFKSFEVIETIENNTKLNRSFFILLINILKWTQNPFNQEFYKKLFNFINKLYNNYQGELYHLDYIIGLLVGRPLNFLPDLNNSVLNLIIDNNSLLSFYKFDENSLLLLSKDFRGNFLYLINNNEKIINYKKKAFDFIIQNQLYDNIFLIKDETINSFNEILKPQIINIGILSFPNNLINNFFLINLNLSMGLFNIQFLSEINNLIQIIYYENQLDINYENELIPKSKLLIFILLKENNNFLITIKTKSLIIYSNNKKLLIPKKSLIQFLSSLIFSFIIQEKYEILFEKEKIRKDYLNNLLKEKICLLELINNYKKDGNTLISTQ